MMTDNVSMTKTPPMIAKMISNFIKIATAASAAPSANDPVSPMNTFAGWALNTRNPNNAPTTANANTMMELNCGNWLAAMSANEPKATAAVPANNPSKPSVKFTAFEEPTMIKMTTSGYNHPSSQWMSVPGILIYVGKSCMYKTMQKMIPTNICPNNFCFDVNPRFRFNAILMKSSKNPINPYPTRAKNNSQNS